MAALALRRVSKVFPNGHAAARDITLDVADGELLVLVGPSGSGKSTVLRLMAGLEAPTAGQILIDGRDVTAAAPQQRDLAMVFQSYALYPHKSVRENLAFGLRMRKVADGRIEERVRATAAALGIEALLDRRPAQLSGGQRQRVALGRALVREPKAFLLDEPLSNLDPQTRVATRAELAVLHRRLGATMVYVTHDQEEAMTLGTRVAVMRDGVVEQLAPPLELYRRPANAFVAGFVGTPMMNIFPAPAPHGVPGDRPLAGVRPQDITLTAPGDGEAAGRVELVEPLGATTVVHVRMDDPAERLLRVVVAGDAQVAADARVGIRIDPARMHLFDQGTGRRLN